LTGANDFRRVLQINLKVLYFQEVVRQKKLQPKSEPSFSTTNGSKWLIRFSKR